MQKNHTKGDKLMVRNETKRWGPTKCTEEEKNLTKQTGPDKRTRISRKKKRQTQYMTKVIRWTEESQT